jgi:tetratricopeptide (TPR) repeat protein
VRAKLHKARGYALRAAGRHRAALDELREALRYNPRAGVKKDAERLEIALRHIERQAASTNG